MAQNSGLTSLNHSIPEPRKKPEERIQSPRELLEAIDRYADRQFQQMFGGWNTSVQLIGLSG
jgi:hypothetical protein